MRSILSVIAPHSGSGKTLFVTHLVRALREVGCLKISPLPGHREPAPAEGGAIGPNYAIVDSSQLSQAGKDTARYLTAGAVQVERLRHRGDGLSAGLAAALERFPPELPIIVESSSAVELLDPTGVLLVIRPPIREMKTTTQAILSRVTDLFVNGSGGESAAAAEAQRLRKSYPSFGSPHVWSANLIAEGPADAFLVRLRALIGQDSSPLTIER